MPQAPRSSTHAARVSAARGLAAMRMSSVTRHKFLLLFLFLLADLILYPYISANEGPRYYLFRSLGVAVTLVTVYVVSLRRELIIIALALAIPAMIEYTTYFRLKMGALSVCSVVLSFAFDVFVIVVLFRRVFAREKPTTETIFGAVCIYLLIGFTFARLYAIIGALHPNAFHLDPAINTHPFAAGFDFIFFSFGTMTSLGANGIVAISPTVRSLSVIESMLGVLYLAVMISRLMGAYRPNYRPNYPGSDES
jgi:hypothetical protein